MLIPKVGGDFHIIRIMEVIWKMVVEILNHRLGVDIIIHEVLHGLWDGHGVGTAFLETKILQ